MKAIMISIKPKWVAKILNGEKTIEIRKNIPKCDLPIDVYIYCTKETQLVKYNNKYVATDFFKGLDCPPKTYNGKVIARFWCDKVENIYLSPTYNRFESTFLNSLELQTKSCLTEKELFDYLGNKTGNRGYACHISKLEIFGKPRELSVFMTPKSYQQYQRDLKQAYKDDEKTLSRLYSGCAFENECANCVELIEMTKDCYGLRKAPQSYCFIEIGE